MPALPPDFTLTIQNTFGAEGRAWLAALPSLIDEASRRWHLTEIQPVPNLSYNFVAFAAQSKGAQGEVVLKIGVPDRELTSEMTALRYFNGKGAVRLLEADAEHGTLLLERLRPGEMLSTLEDDEQATHLAADVMLRLWQPAPAEGALIRLSDWFEGLGKLRRRFGGGTGPLPRRLVERAERAAADFFAEDDAPMLIHGDLHHYNILSSERGWLAIDPKGVMGPAGYEVGPLLINPLPDFLARPNPLHQTERRIAILSERLGLERERLREWGIAHAVLSAWWSLEDSDSGWEYAIRCGEVFAQARV